MLRGAGLGSMKTFEAVMPEIEDVGTVPSRRPMDRAIEPMQWAMM